jgi:hypothetical protein
LTSEKNFEEKVEEEATEAAVDVAADAVVVPMSILALVSSSMATATSFSSSSTDIPASTAWGFLCRVFVKDDVVCDDDVLGPGGVADDTVTMTPSLDSSASTGVLLLILVLALLLLRNIPAVREGEDKTGLKADEWRMRAGVTLMLPGSLMVVLLKWLE